MAWQPANHPAPAPLLRCCFCCCRKAARQLIEAVERNVAFVGRARDQVRHRLALALHASPSSGAQTHPHRLAVAPPSFSPRAHPFPVPPCASMSLCVQVDFSPKDLSQVATFLPKEAAAKQAPVQQYARTLLDRARQRIQMRLADSVELGGGQAGGGGADDRWVVGGWCGAWWGGWMAGWEGGTACAGAAADLFIRLCGGVGRLHRASTWR